MVKSGCCTGLRIIRVYTQIYDPFSSPIATSSPTAHCFTTCASSQVHSTSFGSRYRPLKQVVLFFCRWTINSEVHSAKLMRDARSGKRGFVALEEATICGNLTNKRSKCSAPYTSDGFLSTTAPPPSPPSSILSTLGSILAAK